MQFRLLVPIVFICLIIGGCFEHPPQAAVQSKGSAFVERDIQFQSIQANGGLNSRQSFKVYLKDPGFSQGVDFAQNFLIVAERGQKGSSGYAIKISGIKQTGPGDFTVVLELSDPRPGNFYLTVMTYPRDIAAVKRGYLPSSGQAKFSFVATTGEILATDIVNLD